MKSKIRVSFSIVWLLFVTIPIIITAINLKFPALDYQRYGHIIIPIFLILPLVSVVYSLVTCKLGNTHRVGDILVISGFVIEMICTLVCTYGFRYYNNDFYPLVSTTTDSSNYLEIESRFKETDYKYIEAVFPKEIPEDATDVKYYYRCMAFGIYDIKAQWKLPYEKYVVERERIIARNSQNEKADNDYEYNFIFDNDSFFAKERFDDSKYVVYYEFGTIF